MIVYHGSVLIVKKPDVDHSFRPLDFGKGFYVTGNQTQAEKWARRKAQYVKGSRPVVNCYEMSEISSDLKIKTFPEDLSEWLDFVCDCRDEKDVYQQYDVITGRVADDKVMLVVDMYHAGIWDKERAIVEMKVYPYYNQTAFISQSAIDRLLSFKDAYETKYGTLHRAPASRASAAKTRCREEVKA